LSAVTGVIRGTLRWTGRLVALLLALLLGPLLVAACGPLDLSGDWRSADRSPTGVAPDPALHPEAVVQVYSARAFKWRGIFAVHTWIAEKPAGAGRYRVHQVVGWRARSGLPVVVSGEDVPDRAWYGQRPELVAELRGEAAQAAIARIRAAVERYPYPREYRVWPGPNSNTFVAWILREVPDLEAALPSTAIGKDYLPGGRLFASAPSGTGYQLSAFGALGILAARKEGLEVNLLGLVVGVDPLRPALKIPGLGRVGMRE
jgi:hypothetical protein